MYKIEEIVKDPIRLSAWLDSKNQMLSPVYKSLLDNPNYTLKPDQLPRDTSIKGRKLTHIKIPDWSFESTPSETSHAIERGIQGAWVWPNVVRDIEKLNPDVGKLSREDAQATLKALGITIKSIRGYKAKEKGSNFTKDPSMVRETEDIGLVLEFLFGDRDITWSDALRCVSTLAKAPPEAHMPVLQGRAEIPAKLVNPPLTRARHVLENGKNWNKFTIARDYTAANNQLMLNPKIPITLAQVDKETYTLPNPPEYYLDIVNQQGDKPLIRFVHNQAGMDAPFNFTEDVDSETLARIKNFISYELEQRHYIDGQPSAILAGLEVYTRFKVFFDCRSYLIPEFELSLQGE